MLRLSLALLILAAVPADAMVSGYYDSLNKIEAVLAAPGLDEMLRQQPIGAVTEIGRNKDDIPQWMVRTQDCDVVINLLAHPPEDGMVGMTTYTAEIAQGCDTN